MENDVIVFTSKVGKSGNSSTIVIPPHIIERLGLKKGDFVEIKMRRV